MRTEYMLKYLQCNLIFLVNVLDTCCAQTNSSVFQCQPSSNQGGRVYTPNIPDLYFNNINAADFRNGFGSNLTVASRGVTYIYTIPAKSIGRNCSGNIVAINFCYQARPWNVGDNTIVFNLDRVLTADGYDFTVSTRLTVHTIPQDNICTAADIFHIICCDTFTLGTTQQMGLPSSNYTIAVTVGNNEVRPLVFEAGISQYRYDQLQVPYGNSLPDSFSLDEGNVLTDQSLLLIRFFIGGVAEIAVISNDTFLGVGETAFLVCIGYGEPFVEVSWIFNGATIKNSSLITVYEQDISKGGGLFKRSILQFCGVSVSDEGGYTCVIDNGQITANTTVQLAAGESADAATGSVTMDTTSGMQSGSPEGTETAVSNSFTDAATTTAVMLSGRPLEPEGTETASSSSSSGLIGGLVGGITVAALLIAGVGIFLAVLMLVHKKRKETYSLNMARNFENKVYERDMGMERSCTYEYCQYQESGHEYTELETNPSPAEYITPLDGIYEIPARNVHGLLGQVRAKLLSREAIGLGSHLGSGQFGVVYNGVWASPNGVVEVAVKTLREGSREEDRVKFLQEAAIMGQFKHPNVVEMYGVVTLGEPVLIVLELLSKGDLKSYLLGFKVAERHSVSVDDHTLLKYCRQVASGMAYLSSTAFVHRDLAARNILVSGEDVCKIADFGMSRDLMDENYYVSHGGMIPVKWTAPEALHYRRYSTASDVWSYGALMYEIWSVGHKPFEGFTNTGAIEVVNTGYRLPPPPGCPRGLYAIMISCWSPDTVARPSFNTITGQLSLPDTELLKWSEKDKSVHPEAAQLGADLVAANHLYTDLQAKYKPLQSETVLHGHS